MQKQKPADDALPQPGRTIRVCAAQYFLRPVQSWEIFAQQVKFFVAVAAEYRCHFLLLPEFFTAQLFSLWPAEWDSRTTVKELAGLTDRYLELFRPLAVAHQLYIIGGSHPVWRNDKLYNVAHLFTPGGRVYTQDKLHITPGEREAWDIQPGEGIKIFDTPLARVAVQICYDIEFPEIPRLLALSGVETIFVPFSTDDKRAYQRVRYTAQARAVENNLYVVIAGNVGNLPSRSYLLSYGQSAVFTPSDFAFPPQAIAAEAEPNIETVVLANLDLTCLARQRAGGSVRPLYDRRPELYDLQAKTPLEVIRTE